MSVTADRKGVIIDSSSAILLFKAGIFDCAAAAYDLIVTPSVAGELTRSGHDGSSHFANALAAGRLKTVEDEKCGGSCPELSRLGQGERDSIALYLSGSGIFIIMDDGRGDRICRDMGIPYINALLVARILRDCREIDEDRYAEAFGALLRVGRYSADIVSFARDCEKNRLKDFYPAGEPGKIGSN